MICEKCGKEFSDTVYPLHILRCQGKENKEEIQKEEQGKENKEGYKKKK